MVSVARTPHSPQADYWFLELHMGTRVFLSRFRWEIKQSKWQSNYAKPKKWWKNEKHE